ncbi:kinase-like protein [Delitschia confertaspora ATCC 74209]|uniref:Kinase-like protein n=1 Tax=Delitschia confertaspora ATCC 74209 TaxID=1513339 RepID=A0A9P4MSE3_9PLEO|nr:kinase-like protein [Delitschia confertaspora ATCC 74209]
MDEFDWVKTHTTLSSYGTLSDILINDPKGSGNHIPARRDRGSFASFICHVFHLERSLRALSPILLDNLSNVRVTDKILGQGKTFLVREAFWIKDRNDPPIKAALKEIIPIFQPVDARSSNGSSQQLQNDWNDILFEIRALLHEPIRYHPNLVRLLGIRWGVSPLSESTYPQILMECSPLGTLKTLQSTIDPLPFRTKQTLCYDVGRGLSALHASGIVHGDMKHENVLIFPRSDETGVKYVAKLADFGGSVMDMTSEEFRKVESWTWPFQAPEWESPLSREGMKLTDVYSFGLLIWRLYLDGEGFISMEGAAPGHPDESKQRLADLKETEEFTQIALRDISEYSKDHGIPETCSAIISYAILHTVRTKPSDRSLVKAQVALRGIK